VAPAAGVGPGAPGIERFTLGGFDPAGFDPLGFDVGQETGAGIVPTRNRDRAFDVAVE
jgi:hypothetical protein